MTTSILLTILAVALSISSIVNYYSFKIVFERLSSICEIVELVVKCNKKYISKIEKLEGKND